MEIRLGTRGSKLAMIQTESVRTELLKKGVDSVVVTHSTRGDRNTTSPIFRMNSVGVFVQELNDMIMSGEVDAAVHSAKDIPSSIPGDLEISAVLPRASYNDVLVSDKPLEDMASGSRIGTSSRRRISELRNVRSDLLAKDIRGNIDTRLKKLRNGYYDGVILAEAALNRLGEEVKHFRLDEESFLPAPNQGIIAVTSRKGSEASNLLKMINDDTTFRCFSFERELVVRLKLGCSMPAGILCIPAGESFEIRARFYSLNSDEYRNYRTELRGGNDIEKLADEIIDTLPDSFGYKIGV